MKLIIVRGLPGAGKSSFCEKNFECLHVEADMFLVQDGEYKWNPKALGFAHKSCLRMAETMLDYGKDVAVANTFTTMKELNPYVALAERYGATLEVYRVESDFDSVHDVPPDTIEKMRSRFVDFPGEKVIEFGSKV